MAINFLQIPIALRVPGQYVEFDNSRAVSGLTSIARKALIIGPKHHTNGSVAAGSVVRTNKGLADSQFGAGSFLAGMIKKFQANNAFTDLWAIADEARASACAASTWTIAFTGTATAAGTLSLMVGGRPYKVAVASGDTNSDVGTALVTAIGADADALVTASGTTTVTIVAVTRGAIGNTLTPVLNYGDNDTTPAGITVGAVTQTVTPTAVPTLTSTLTALADEQYDYIVFPYTDDTSMDAIEAFLAERNHPLRQIHGLAFAAAVDSLGNLGTLGSGRNSQFSSIIGMYGTPTPAPMIAAAYGAVAAYYLANDPARPLQTLELVGVYAPAVANRFTLPERNTLLYGGISTVNITRDGRVLIERAITTYQTNALSLPDASYLDVTTLATLFAIREQVRIKISNTYPRHKLASDTAQIQPGQAIVRPKDIKIALLSLFDAMADQGWVEGVDETEMIVERNATDPNRVDAVLPPDLVNGFQVFAAQVQFQL